MRLFRKLTAAAIICVAAVSCTDKTPDIEPRDPVIFQNASATYYGATENHEAYFTMDLTDGDKKLHLEFYGDPVGDYDAPTIKTGNYNIATGSATEPGTYIAGSGEDGCVYSESNGANADIYDIVDGVFSISLSGTIYNVTVGLKDQDGKDLQGTYTGPITVEDTREDIPSDFASGFAQFYGKAVTDDTHAFWIGFDSDGIVRDPSTGEYTGDGYFIRFLVMTGTDAFTEIPDGTYNLDTSIASGTIVINNEYTYYTDMVNDVATTKAITSGAVTFRRSGDIYTVAMDVTDADGNNYNKLYRGELKYNNYSGSFLGDVDLGAFAWGQLAYYGRSYAGNAYNFIVLLLGDGVGLDSQGYFTGSGYIMVMDVYTEKISSKDIPPATYSVDGTTDPGTVAEGYLFLAWDLGSYIYELEDGVVISSVHIKGGTVTVSGANPNYNFQMAFKDPSGYNVTSSYSGGLEYFDESSDNVVLPATDPADRYQFATFKPTNYGDYYHTGTTNLGIYFNTDDLSLYMDIITTDIGDSKSAPAGTYTFAENKLENTFCEYSRINYQEAGLFVEGGTMTITDLNDAGDRMYTFDLDMGEKGMFYGEYEYSAFEDINLTEFEGGNIQFFGNEYSGISNNFYISMYGPGVTETGGYFSGTGYIITMDLYADLSATTEIPDGVYSVTNSDAAGNILISSTDTRYFEIVDSGTSVIRTFKSGSATVSKSGDTYTFDMAFVDSYGKNITGIFTGGMAYINQTAFSASGNYVELPSAKTRVRETVISKPDMTKPDADGAGPANALSKDAKKNAFKYKKSAELNRFTVQP